MDQISSMAYNERWAVITAPYTTFYENPEISNNSTKHGRKGDILKVEGKRIKPLGKNESEIWYKLEEGWVEEKNIYICRNQFQAREYSSKLISSSN
ncbi:MAG: hypothetical protein K5839_03600 [Treponemataceae bacterium]|nr:hypothetical protein [Treponemataceae bacterium]